MSFYRVESWTIRDVANAFKLSDGDSQNRRVVIPIFQRGLRWGDARRKEFIDSLNRGYPFGSLLFACHEDNANLYSVVDGLQRGTTVCEYVFNPLGKNNIVRIDDYVLENIKLSIFPESKNMSINKEIEKIVLEYFYEKKTFDEIDLSDLAGIIFDEFANDQEFRSCTDKIKHFLKEFIKKSKDDYNNVCSSSVPIVVYSGPQELLNEIFNRINVNGIPLNKFEIYAATWRQNKKVVNNLKVVEHVVKKYLSLASENYEIEGFNTTEMVQKRELTAFEFLFGLGKYWTEEYDCLQFDSKKSEGDVNEISFEIVDGCISNSNNIANLDKNLYKYNINKLERRIEEAIKYVSDSISVVSNFKGNNRKFKVLHSKYQIVSLIVYTFRLMYDPENLDRKKSSWDNICGSFSKNILQYYVADIISNEWHDGGGSKVYSALNEKRYNDMIGKNRWESLLDNYYQTQLSIKQSQRFSNPTNADSVILNCVYADLFTAKDQLSSSFFDIEHLATKEKMKCLIKQFDNLQLPVSCIANLCYLPENINRGKKDKTLYEVTNLSMPIDIIENKYSFTNKDDLEWLNQEYSSNDRLKLEENYLSFLDKRYSIIRNKFLSLFGF